MAAVRESTDRVDLEKVDRVGDGAPLVDLPSSSSSSSSSLSSPPDVLFGRAALRVVLRGSAEGEADPKFPVTPVGDT